MNLALQKVVQRTDAARSTSFTLCLGTKSAAD